MSTFKEQEWRLVTNLTKLRALSRVTQQALTMWLEAVLLTSPAGSSKGHRRRCWQLLETEAEPTTHPSAPWELRDEGTIILDPLNCDWCHSSWVLWLDILPTVAWGHWIFSCRRDRPTAGCKRSRLWLQTLISPRNPLCSQLFYFLFSISPISDLRVFQ